MDSTDAATLDDLAEKLAELRLRAGNPSFTEIARRIGALRAQRGVRSMPPGRVTVYDAFRTGRSRMDIELVADIVAVLGRSVDVPRWRRAHAAILRRRAKERGGRISTARAQVTPVQRPGILRVVAHEEEREQLCAALLARGREGGSSSALALVTGLPGVGKTVLARAVAGDLAEALDTDAVIEAALLSHAGGGAEGTPDPGDVATEILRLRKSMRIDSAAPTIVVLDDVTSFDDLSVVASALPDRSVVIATARQALPADDTVERILLEPLDDARAERLLRQLISDRDEHDGRMLRRLAGLTGGLPLGIVLLAAQLDGKHGWSLEDHAARLENSSSAALAPRLTSAFAHLTPGARHALQLLAQHPGRLDDDDAAAYLDSASKVAQPAWSIPRALEELTRDHFLERSADHRYGMHDVVRALATEHALVDEPLSLRRAAAADLSRALERTLRTTRLDSVAMAAFDASVDVHLSTLALAAEHRLVHEVMRHAETLHPWLHTSLRWNDIILVNEHTRRLATPADRPAAERRLCQALTSGGRLDEAEVILTGLADAGDVDPRWYETVALLGSVAHLRGDAERALELSRAAIDGARAAGDGPIILWTSGLISEPLTDLGHSDEAVRALEAALAEHPNWETPHIRIPAMIDLGAALVWADRLDDARARFDAARREAVALGNRAMTAFCSGWCGGVDVLLGEVAAGRAAIAAADRALRDSGRENARVWMKVLHADACLRAGDPETARDIAAEALATCEELHFDDNAAHCRVLFARIAIAEGRDDAAHPLLEGVLDGRTPRARVQALEQLGILARRRGDRAGAIDLWQAALELTPSPLFEHRLRELLAQI